MLDREETARRIVAARTVRGLDQRELEAAFYEAGNGEFPKGAIGDIERRNRPLGEGGRTILARLLDVPDWWFTADDPFAPLRNGQDPELGERVGKLEAEISRLALAGLDEDEERSLGRRRAPSAKQTGARSRGSRTKGGA